MECGERTGAWFWAKAELRADVGGRPRRRHLWQRVVFLLRADSLEAAWPAAEDLARRKEHEYRNAAGALVQWRAVRVVDVQALDDPEPMPGTEVYWEFFDRGDHA